MLYLKNSYRYLFIILIVSMLFTITSCSQNKRVDKEKYSNLCENSLTGDGRAYCTNDYLYFTVNGEIYEYDLLTGKLVQLSKASQTFASGLMADEEGVYFSDDWGNQIKRLNFVDKKISDVWTVESNLGMFYGTYYSGSLIYGLVDGQGADFTCYDTEKKTQSLISKNVLNYYVYEDKIFYITNNGETSKDNPPKLYLIESSKEPVELDLGVVPIKISVFDTKAILCEFGTYQTYLYDFETEDCTKLDFSEGVETDWNTMEVTPFENLCYNFQIMGNTIFYRTAEKKYDYQAGTLYSYDLKTKETAVLLEKSDHGFSVFNENLLYTTSDEKPVVITIKNGKPTITEIDLDSAGNQAG